MKGALNKVILEILHWYRSNISPKKGYRCAHNTLHGNGSCSDWALSVTQSESAVEMIKKLPNRFIECKSAFIALKNILSLRRIRKKELKSVENQT